MAPKVTRVKVKPFPDTFAVALMEMIAVTLSNPFIGLCFWYFVWSNESRNDVFVNGFGPFRGWSCGDRYPNAGHYMAIAMLISGCCLYIPSLIFLLLDHYLERRGTLQKYKIRYPAPRPPQTTISWKLYRKSIAMAFENASILGFFAMQFLFLPLMEWRGNCDHLIFVGPPSSSLSYDIMLLMVRLVATNYVSDVIFYFTHRVCHEVKWLYQRVHKMHHQFVDTYGISATACHPIEHVFVNLSTVMGSGIVTGLPIIPYCVFMALACLSTTFAHSGFGNPFRTIQVGNATPHDYHHHYQNCEYGNGANGFCDKLFGTRFQDLYPMRYKEMQREYGVFEPDSKKID